MQLGWRLHLGVHSHVSVQRTEGLAPSGSVLGVLKRFILGFPNDSRVHGYLDVIASLRDPHRRHIRHWIAGMPFSPRSEWRDAAGRSVLEDVPLENVRATTCGLGHTMGVIRLTFTLTGLDTSVAHCHIELLSRKASTVQPATEYGSGLRFLNPVLDSD